MLVLLFDEGEVAVFDCVFGAAGELLGKFGPTLAEVEDEFEEEAVFFICPFGSVK